MKPTAPNYIVGIGGSAGALNAYKTLLQNLPSNSGMAFVIVSHINPAAESQLAQILARHTKMPVSVASESMAIHANHVYVIPANSDLKVEKHFFKVITPRIGRNQQIDVFFASLAEAMGANAIGIIFSGYDGDGTKGCMHIKAKGGTIFSQDKSAEVGDMPMSAQDANCVDFVLPPEEISYQLTKISARFLQDNP